MGREYSKEIAEQINLFLSEGKWKYQFDEENGVFAFSLKIGKPVKQLAYYMLVYDTSFLTIANIMISADPNDRWQMQKIAEFFCRVNWDLRNGSFETNFEDGEIRYRICVECAGSLPTAEMIRNSINCPAAMCEKYWEGITGLLFRDYTVEEAIEVKSVSEIFPRRSRALLELLAEKLGTDAETVKKKLDKTMDLDPRLAADVYHEFPDWDEEDQKTDLIDG